MMKRCQHSYKSYFKFFLHGTQKRKQVGDIILILTKKNKEGGLRERSLEWNEARARGPVPVPSWETIQRDCLLLNWLHHAAEEPSLRLHRRVTNKLSA